MQHTPHYDVAIIGAGMGGLMSAALLSRCGLKVLLVEKEPHAGGYLAGYQKRGYRFDTAIHWLNQCSPQGFVTRMFAVLGQDYPVCKSLQHIRRIKGQSIDVSLTSNPDELCSRLVQQYPEDKAGIERFFKKSKQIGKSFFDFGKIFRATETMSLAEKAQNIYRLLQFVRPLLPYISYTGNKMEKGLHLFFKNKELHKIFSSEPDLLSCMVPVGWAYYNDFQTPPQGGGQVLAEWLLHICRHYRATVAFNAAAEKIITTGHTATGLSYVQKGTTHTVTAAAIIAACDIETVYTALLPAGAIPAKKLAALSRAEMYASSLTISIALDCPAEALGFGEEMVHLFKEDIAKAAHNNGDPDTAALTILAPSAKDKALAPQGCGTLVIFMPAYMHQYQQWHTEAGLQRGEAYEKLKTTIAETLIHRVATQLAPALKAHIVFYDVATPVTHWRYTGNKNGTMMGAKPGKINMQLKVAGYRTPVKNLYMGGHWAELGGGVPIAVKAGSNAALLVLKKQNATAYKWLLACMEGRPYDYVATGTQPYTNDFKRRPTAAEKLQARHGK